MEVGSPGLNDFFLALEKGESEENDDGIFNILLHVEVAILAE